MTLAQDRSTALRTMPTKTAAAVGILWIYATVGFITAYVSWENYLGEGGGSPLTGLTLLWLMATSVFKAVLTLGVHLRQSWARSGLLIVGLIGAVTAGFAMFSGNNAAIFTLGVNLAFVILLILPDSAAWCEK